MQHLELSLRIRLVVIYGCYTNGFLAEGCNANSGQGSTRPLSSPSPTYLLVCREVLPEPRVNICLLMKLKNEYTE